MPSRFIEGILDALFLLALMAIITLFWVVTGA